MIQQSPASLRKYGGMTSVVFPLQTVAASGNSRLTPISVLPFTHGMFFLRCTAISGGGAEELDVWIETKDPQGDYWFTLTSFWPILTGVGGRIKTPFMLPILGEKICVAYDLSDITSVTFAVNAVLKI